MTTEQRLAHLEELAGELIAQNRKLTEQIQKLQQKLSAANQLQREQEELTAETEALVLLEQAKQALLRLAEKRKQLRTDKNRPVQAELEEFPEWLDMQE